jgi:hypothetical protein
MMKMVMIKDEDGELGFVGSGLEEALEILEKKVLDINCC